MLRVASREHGTQEHGTQGPDTGGSCCTYFGFLVEKQPFD